MKTAWYEGGEDYTPCAAVRKTVFIDEQGYLPEEEFDEADKTCRISCSLTEIRPLPQGGWCCWPTARQSSDVSPF